MLFLCLFYKQPARILEGSALTHGLDVAGSVFNKVRLTCTGAQREVKELKTYYYYSMGVLSIMAFSLFKRIHFLDPGNQNVGLSLL